MLGLLKDGAVGGVMGLVLGIALAIWINPETSAGRMVVVVLLALIGAAINVFIAKRTKA